MVFAVPIVGVVLLVVVVIWCAVLILTSLFLIEGGVSFSYDVHNNVFASIIVACCAIVTFASCKFLGSLCFCSVYFLATPH